MKPRYSLFYKVLVILIAFGTIPAVLVSLRLLYYNQYLLIAGGGSWNAPLEAVEQLNRALLGESLAYIFYTLVTVSIFSIFISAGLIRPVRQMKDLLGKFLENSTDDRAISLEENSLPLVSSTSNDEFDQLYFSLRQVIGDLTGLRQKLELEVQERTKALRYRTRQMESAAIVAQDAASIRDLDQLLSKVAHLISDDFGYYHTGIYLLDKTGEYAVLRAATSPGGQQMLARGYKLSVAEASIVGHVVNTRQPRSALSTGVDAFYFKNPYLPETRSEMALPLITGGGSPVARGKTISSSNTNPEINQKSEKLPDLQHLWGVLDVQSRSEEAFNPEDIAVLQVLANQVAIAIENAHLSIENQMALTELQISLESSRMLYSELTSDAWRKLLQARPEIGYIATSSVDYSSSANTELSTAEGDWPPDMVIASQSGQSMQSDPYTLIIPIRMRDMTAGVLRLRKAENAPPWSRSEIDLMHTLTEQLGVALESARLYDETRRRAERERLTGEITARMRASNDPQIILQTAMDELRQALQTSQARILIHKVEK